MLIKQCIQCSLDFRISDDEEKSLSDKGLDLPLRCQTCRKHKKKLGGQPNKAYKNKKRRYDADWGGYEPVDPGRKNKYRNDWGNDED